MTVAWVFFRTPTLGAAGHYLAALVGLGGSGPTAALVGGLLFTPLHLLALVAAAALVWLAPASQRVAATVTPARAGLAVATLWLALVMLAVQSHSGFLYAVF